MAESVAVSERPSFSVVRFGAREAVMQSRFAAPPTLVFDALTQPAQLRQWLSAGGRELVVCDVDLRPGGAFRYVFRGPDGREFGMFGNYLEVVAARRIVHSEAYDGYDWEPLIVTTELNDEDEGTLMVVTIMYPSEELRDLDFPNLEHALETYSRLRAYLKAA